MHHEMRELPVYAMVVSDGGSKLQESDPANTGQHRGCKRTSGRAEGFYGECGARAVSEPESARAG